MAALTLASRLLLRPRFDARTERTLRNAALDQLHDALRSNDTLRHDLADQRAAWARLRPEMAPDDR